MELLIDFVMLNRGRFVLDVFTLCVYGYIPNKGRQSVKVILGLIEIRYTKSKFICYGGSEF